MNDIEWNVTMRKKQLSNRQPKQTYLLSLYVKISLFLCNYCIDIYSLAKYIPTLDCFYVIIVLISIAWLNICRPLVMWYLSSGVLCSHHMTRNTLVHICNNLNDTCCIQFRIHSRFHQVYRQLGAGGRLMAITVILPFLDAPSLLSAGRCHLYHCWIALNHTNCGLSATRCGRQVTWLHATWGHILMEHLQMKCVP